LVVEESFPLRVVVTAESETDFIASVALEILSRSAAASTGCPVAGDVADPVVREVLAAGAVLPDVAGEDAVCWEQPARVTASATRPATPSPGRSERL